MNIMLTFQALRKLHGGQDLSDFSKFDVKDDPDEDTPDQFADTPEFEAEVATAQEIVPAKSQKSKKKKKNKNAATPVNPFDLLNEEENDNLENLENGIHEDNTENDHIDGNTETQSAKKKKRKKKKKRTETNSSEIQHDGENEEDEIEASIREVNEMLGEIPTRLVATNPGSLACRSLLNIEHKHFNPDNEMRRIFGSRVVQAEPTRNRRQRNRGARRNTWLVQPKNTWPHLSKTGLGMDLVDSNSKDQHFVFTHNKEYQKIQFQFLDAVESIEPQNLINMAQLYPHHIDTLLQVSEICKMSEDVQMAAEFIERALYIFECAFHSLFSLTQDNIRLDYKCQENRAFYIALFRHLNFVGKRGCYRTALEFCKLLLRLDPDGDPLCVLLMIDFYALRSEQYDFLIKLYQEWEAHRNLSQLPNLALSVPLAMFHQAEQNSTDTTTADQLLQEGLIMFPSVLHTLLDKCSIAPDGDVLKHSFFVQAQYGQHKALEQLIALYVGRTFSCWKAPEVVAWLERNVRTVLKRVDEKDPLVADCENKRKSRYQGTPRNIHRHIMISEVAEATAALPPDLAHIPVMSYDPLPPTDSVAAYTQPPRASRTGGNSNPLSLFFQSLMPNFNPQEPVEAELGAAGGEARNFRDGVTQVMNAMRDLLNNIQPVAPPVENAGNDEDEENEENHDWD